MFSSHIHSEALYTNRIIVAQVLVVYCPTVFDMNACFAKAIWQFITISLFFFHFRQLMNKIIKNIKRIYMNFITALTARERLTHHVIYIFVFAKSVVV